jgi:hypothetical protein
MTGDVVSLFGDVTSNPLGDVTSGDVMSSSRKQIGNGNKYHKISLKNKMKADIFENSQLT